MVHAVRVGVLNDIGNDAASAVGDVTDWLRREVDALRAVGRLQADVEFVHAYGLGLPSGAAVQGGGCCRGSLTTAALRRKLLEQGEALPDV